MHLAALALETTSQDIETANRIADFKPFAFCRRMERGDVTGAFVAYCHWGAGMGEQCHHIGVAEGGRGDFDEELRRAWHGDGDGVYNDFGLDLGLGY